MIQPAVITAGLSLAAIAAGLFLLFYAWKHRSQPVALGAGWALIAASLIAAFIANADRGVAQIIVIAMCLTGVFFAASLLSSLPRADYAAGRNRKADTSPAPSSPVRKNLARVWTFILTGPVAGIIALFAAATMFRVINRTPDQIATHGVLAIITAVVLWGVISVLLLMETRLMRRTLFAVSGAAIFAITAWI
ncbi:hypothetical protein [Ponticaulis sp.]|uniref:hypothetical protein n=1 Tax=Ponticaulis sp. TaxID=2020902 RepID=UPI00263638A6|nr:hypothetical protein [Ponticaulis sp.]MDF1680842.1 hypothetical protein [Ponticaulis sp.]